MTMRAFTLASGLGLILASLGLSPTLAATLTMAASAQLPVEDDRVVRSEAAAASELPSASVRAVATPPSARVASSAIRAAAAAETTAPASAGDDPPEVTVRSTPSEPGEDAGEIVFTVELSRPHEELVVVIYATVDADAVAGADYGAKSGILTLRPGATSGEIRTAVIDDAEVEGDEGFQLFLAADPKVTSIRDPWTKVTIRDDD